MKKTHLIYLLIIINLIFLFSCKKEKELTEQDYPLIQTEEVEIITDTGIVANATILKPGTEEILDYGFVWNETGKPTIENSRISIGPPLNRL